MQMNTYETIIGNFKNSLSIEEIIILVADLGGEPIKKGNFFVSKTICHNPKGEGSHKLYYYDNTKLFRCYTDCENSVFDIFDLITKVKKLEGFTDWKVTDSVTFAASYFGRELPFQKEESGFGQLGADWKYFNKMGALKDIEVFSQRAELKVYDESILSALPHPRIIAWESDGILPEIIEQFGIAYNPVSGGIVIPHYNIDNQLIGIRERTLVKDIEVYGKYRPMFFNRQLYNHPLGFNLYNINATKENIQAFKTAIVFEGEKSCLQYASYFGCDNDISVACCGSSLTEFQFNLLKRLGVQEIIIGFDKQFQEIGDLEWQKWTKKLTLFHTKYGNQIQISYLFDTRNLLSYKDSPTDQGQEIFLQLYENRVTL